MSKLILDTQDITDGFFEDTRLLGIMAPMKDYQFCWQVNNMLGVDFRVNNEIEIQLKKKNRNYFLACMNIMSRPRLWSITFIITSLTANTCCQSSSTWTFCG